MKSSLWSCGLVVALVGCGGFDRGYTPPPQSAYSTNRTPPLPPSPSTAAWQQPYNRGPTPGSRSPADMASNGFGGGLNSNGFGAGAAAATGPQAGAMTTLLPGGDPLRSSQALPQRTPYGATAAGGPPLVPPDSRPQDRGFSDNSAGIQRVGYDGSNPPLQGVPPDSLPRTDQLRNSAGLTGLPPGTPPPLLMAGNDGKDRSPGDDMMARRAPSPLPEPMDAAPRSKPAEKPARVAVIGPELSEPPSAPPAPLKMDEPPASPPTPTVASKPTEDNKPSGPQPTPAVRMVNSKRIVLNYELRDVGPSGVSSVELYVTRDGRSWHKDESAKSGPPYVVEVPEEGMYGFTLVAKNGVGVGKQPPQPGDLPQVWVEVDMTSPTVSLHDVKAGNAGKPREVVITWDAHDRNLARKPITLSFSTTKDGPWLPFATNVENTGRFTWTIPQNGPMTFYTRVEAVDLVGNVGSAQSSTPTAIDSSRPVVSIVGVEAAEK